MDCLAIETSCDDTCASVVKDEQTSLQRANSKKELEQQTCSKKEQNQTEQIANRGRRKGALKTGKARAAASNVILSNVVFSQDVLHKRYGGVFPEMAAREHVKNLLPTIHEALIFAKKKLEDIDLFAATKGPGLITSLLNGLNAAKTLACLFEKPFLGVHHVEAHLYPALLQGAPLPSLGLVLSGGHTTMVLIEEKGKYKHIGSTVDDAIGEAFDKLAFLLGYSYPGGKVVEELAKKGDPLSYPFRAGLVKASSLSFSFSGLKTAALYAIRKEKSLSPATKADIAASFQQAAFSDVIEKIRKSSLLYPVKSVLFGGGVSQNQQLQKMCQTLPLPSFFPEKKLCSDNAAMIGMLALHKWKEGQKDSLDCAAFSRASFFLV